MRPTTLILFIALLATRALAGDFDVAPPPAWVERVDADASVAVARSDVRWGIYGILTDHQVRVADSGTGEYFRRVRKVLSPSGVQNASELSIEFDPSFQRLVLHEVSVVRGAQRIDALVADDVRVIEKEDEANERIYDGERTALIFVKDVRPGDVIDYSWSILGANPLLGGKYADEYDLSSGIPARLVRHRLVWPTGRELRWRSSSKLEPQIVAGEAETTYLWERRNVAAIDVEDGIPDWFEPWDTVQLSDFASWNDVARWSDAMFVLDDASSAAVKLLADDLRSKHATLDRQILAAIRFVQDEIRYLGIEMGRNSHEPHQPSETLAQRWGDCKDKTFLLVALLRELGVAAYPALVNTSLQHRLDDRLPSPFLFDHVIARIDVAGRTFWVDGTISDQGGTLQTIETPNDGRALVIHPDTQRLQTLVTNAKASTLVERTYTSADYDAPTTLHVKSTYRGGDADSMRSMLGTYSVADLAKDRINDLAADHPKIAANGAPKIVDDRDANVITIDERYTVRDLWRNGRWTYYPRVVERSLARPDTMIRSMPLAFDFPLDVTQKLTFNLPEALDLETSTNVTENATFRYESTIDRSGKTVTITQSLRARKDHVAVPDVADHLSKLNDIFDEVGYTFAPERQVRTAAADIQAFTASLSSRMSWSAIAVGAFVGVCCFLAIPRTRLRPRRRETRSTPRARRFTFGPGEAPASALAVRDAEDLRRRLAELACACGATIASDGDMQRARYDEKELTIVTRNCTTCGREQSLYFGIAV